jgi:serine/threonine protein kinase
VVFSQRLQVCFLQFPSLLARPYVSTSAHRRLSKTGILHRDIRPESIYLWDVDCKGGAPTPGNEGFLVDFDLAPSLPRLATDLVAVPPIPDFPDKTIQAGPHMIRIPSNDSQHPPPRSTTPQGMAFEMIKSDLPKRVDQSSFTVSCRLTIYNLITALTLHKQGTAPFLAKEILDSFHRKTPAAYDVHHDLESFLLVIIYSLYRRFTKLNPSDDALHEEFHQLFGGVMVDDIFAARRDLSQLLPQLRRIVANQYLVYLIALCCRFIDLQNQLKKDTLRKQWPNLPPKQLRQLITYDQLDMYIRQLLLSLHKASL